MRVVTMVTEAEYKVLKLLANNAGQSVSAFCHDLLGKAIISANSEDIKHHIFSTERETK